MLEARNLRKSFGELVATDDISLEFGREDGEMVFIVGPNGAGKTTLVNLLTGHLMPDSGEVRMNGQDITGMRPQDRVEAGLVRSFQIVHIFEEMTARENLRVSVLAEQGLIGSMRSVDTEHDRVEAAVEDLLAKFRLEESADMIAEHLPHGDRKLLDVAMAFGRNPEYLLLDEPTSGVAGREKEYVIERITDVSKNEGVPTVTIEHDMEIVSTYADRMVALHQGRVLAEGPPTLLEEDDELRRVLLGVKA